MTRKKLAELEPAIALGALDGRYRLPVADLVDYLSEPALNRERINVEVEWVIALCDWSAVPGLPQLTAQQKAHLRSIVSDFGAEGIVQHAEHEKVTQHDVKAVEYYIKDHLSSDLKPISEAVHFCCTSEDINNLSYALVIKGAINDVWLPNAKALVGQFQALAKENADVPMLSLTHGQPATPTTLGKEMAVIAHRLERQLCHIEQQEYLGKFNGATGTYGAHYAAVPGTNWVEVAQNFVEESLGLTFNPLTTQIESHDWQAELYGKVAHFNRILHNAATDIWSYISRGIFTQVPVEGTTGSSTMPHKINPIKFENAEANLEISNALLDVLSATLVTSRMQRDLTDSTSQRNIGTAFGHSLLAISNFSAGLTRLLVNTEQLNAELDENWEVLAEPIQSAMRAAGIAGVSGMEKPYERLKDLTRGHRIGATEIKEFVKTLGLPADIEERLSNLTPATYLGVAKKLAE